MLVELNENEIKLLRQVIGNLKESITDEYEIRLSKKKGNQKAIIRGITLMIADANDDITGDYSPNIIDNGYVWTISADILNKIKVELKTKNWLDDSIVIYKDGKNLTDIVLKEAEEPSYMNGDISVWDREKIKKGIAPRWAKKVTSIGPRPKQLRQSSAPSEVAMRKVTNPNEKKPYTESDWKRDKELRKEENERLGKRLEKLLPKNVKNISADDKEVSIMIGKYIFRVESLGLRYKVLRFNPESVLDRKSEICRSLEQVVEFISNNEE